MSHKGTNIFSQIVDHIDKRSFARIVRNHNGERHAKGFLCWEQLVSMVFCQLGKAQSLREICGGLATCMGKLSHLGLSKSPKRSTLSYANEHRSCQIFEETFYRTLTYAQSSISGKKTFRFKNKLFSMDATVIDLCLSLFDWAKFRRTKGAIKLHLLLDHDGYLPVFAHITDGKTHESTVAREIIANKFSFPAESIIVFDRGYTDYEQYAFWCEQGVYFVTRLKHNATYDVLQKNPVPQNSNILKDEIIQFNGPQVAETCEHDLRRIEVWDEENQQVLVLLTNHLRFGSTTIAKIYKERWQIEIFFKTLKQNLKIKTFVGTSANALKIQIWTALLVILILKILKARSTFAWSLSNLVAMLRFNLFTYRDLDDWLNNPYQCPPFVPDTQLSIFGLGQQQGAYSSPQLKTCPI
jgi:transposase